jgi:hypothetical protein
MWSVCRAARQGGGAASDASPLLFSGRGCPLSQPCVAVPAQDPPFLVAAGRSGLRRAEVLAEYRQSRRWVDGFPTTNTHKPHTHLNQKSSVRLLMSLVCLHVTCETNTAGPAATFVSDF